MTCAKHTIPHSTSNCEDDTAYGEKCQITCDVGFVGDAEIACGDNEDDEVGDWNLFPTCTGTLFIDFHILYWMLQRVFKYLLMQYS